MRQPYRVADLLLRSMLFVPAHVERYFQSALRSEADTLVLDLEDSVPQPNKVSARETIKDKLGRIEGRYPTFVRVNSAESGLLEEDLRAIVAHGLMGIILPKVRRPEDVRSVENLLSELEAEAGLPESTCRILPLIETCRAALQVLAIAEASPRVIGLVFGHEDFLLDFQAPHRDEDELNLLVPRMQIAMAARAIGGHPIDTPYLRIKDTEGCARRVAMSRQLGFEGMLVLHPVQIEIANAGYAPSQAEVQEARNILAQAEEAMRAQRSIAFSGGRFTAPPILKQAGLVLEADRRIRARHGRSK